MLIYSNESLSSTTTSSSSSSSNFTSSTSTNSPSSKIDLASYRQQELERLSKSIKRISERDSELFAGYNYVPELVDQNNIPIPMSKNDSSALSECMLLHAKGRYILSNAEKQAKYFQHKLKEQVNNKYETSSNSSTPSTRINNSILSPSSSTLPIISLPIPSEEEIQNTLKEARLSSLGYFLLAANALSRVENTQLLTLIDNPAHLYLDIVWLYYRLNDINNIDAANDYLERAIQGFRIAHGPGLQRLFQISGESCTEKILYVRLHLLQAILAYYKGDSNTCSIFLGQAQSECEALSLKSYELETLINLGYKRKEAITALRATSNQSSTSNNNTMNEAQQYDLRIGRAINYAIEAREKKEAQRATDLEFRRINARQRRLGATKHGYNLNISLLDNLVQMGFAEVLVIEALKQTDNHENNAIELLTNNIEQLIISIEQKQLPTYPVQNPQYGISSSNPTIVPVNNTITNTADNTTPMISANSDTNTMDAQNIIQEMITNEAVEDENHEDENEETNDNADIYALATNLQGNTNVLDNEKWYAGLSTGDNEENALQEEQIIINLFLEKVRGTK